MTAEDIEYLARVMIAETGAGALDDPEGWGVAWVAYNRMQPRTGRSRRTMRQVVAGADQSWPGGGEDGRAFVTRIALAPGQVNFRNQEGPMNDPGWSTALAFARSFAAGAIANPIGSREHFSHPVHFDVCSPPGSRNAAGTKVCVRYPSLESYFASRGSSTGARMVPNWLTPDAMVVGRAVFAR